MELIERILSQVVGAELSEKELEEVAGGVEDQCARSGGWKTGVGNDYIECDY